MEDLIKEPIISVGILRASEISVDFSESFVCKDLGLKYSGHKEVTLKNGVPTIDGLDVTGLLFEPANGHSDFSIDNVQIGIGFHWDRRMRQTFGGSVKFVVDGDKIWAVNLIGVESYLKCVISSEMKSTSDLELLKAHAVTSRSWLMAQVWGKSKFHGQQKREEDGEIVTWRDREDHDLFDVCADDHCQRYQGVTMASNANVNKAIDATRGQLLVYDGEINTGAKFVLTFNGSVKNPAIYNKETGEYIRLISTFTRGDEIEIDTTKGGRGVKKINDLETNTK